MINFIRLGVVNHIAQSSGCTHIPIMQKQPCAAIHDVGILVEVVDAFRVEGTRPTDDAMDFIALGQQEFCQV